MGFLKYVPLVEMNPIMESDSLAQCLYKVTLSKEAYQQHLVSLFCGFVGDDVLLDLLGLLCDYDWLWEPRYLFQIGVQAQSESCWMLVDCCKRMYQSGKPLFECLIEGHYDDYCCALLALDEDRCQWVREDGATLLHVATIYNRLPLVEGLMKTYSLDPEAVTNLGLTPLHIAVRYGYLELAEYLLKEGVCVNKRSFSGDTPLHLAIREASIPLSRLLLRYGADPSIEAGDGLSAMASASIAFRHGLEQPRADTDFSNCFIS